jgi:hypothetical protein
VKTTTIIIDGKPTLVSEDWIWENCDGKARWEKFPPADVRNPSRVILTGGRRRTVADYPEVTNEKP